MSPLLRAYKILLSLSDENKTATGPAILADGDPAAAEKNQAAQAARLADSTTTPATEQRSVAE